MKRHITSKKILFLGAMGSLLLSPALLAGNEVQLNSLSAVQLKENATPVEIIDTYARQGDDVTTYGQVVDVDKRSGEFIIKGSQGATIAVSVIGMPGVMYGDKVVVNGSVVLDQNDKEIKGRSVYVTDYAVD